VENGSLCPDEANPWGKPLSKKQIKWKEGKRGRLSFERSVMNISREGERTPSRLKERLKERATDEERPTGLHSENRVVDKKSAQSRGERKRG